MSVCIIGAGPSGCICAYHLIKKGIEVSLFDKKSPLLSLLPTGGGRCNLGYAEYDYRELAKNYPRGEKFLYSVFSKFSTYDTIAMFREIKVETYEQEDRRIFPKSNSAKDVREKILFSIKNANFIKETVTDILPLETGYKIKTNYSSYYFDNVIIATGGLRNKEAAINGIKHNICTLKPSLVGLNCNVNNLSGIVLNNVYSKDCKLSGDVLFTHFGVSGPLIYKISSIRAYSEYPYKLIFDLYPKEFNFQEILNSNSKKLLKNILSEIFPYRFAEYIAGKYSEFMACNVNAKIRDSIINKIHNFDLTISGTNKGEETVTAGGYNLNEIDSKTMESKIHKGLYIIGEALNVDGYCGGFNLQNAWSTAYVAANSIK